MDVRFVGRARAPSSQLRRSRLGINVEQVAFTGDELEDAVQVGSKDAAVVRAVYARAGQGSGERGLARVVQPGVSHATDVHSRPGARHGVADEGDGVVGDRLHVTWRGQRDCAGDET
jgi:hypothetical protein